MLSEAEKLAFMTEAMDQARLSMTFDEVPIGCIVVKDGQVVGRGHNRRETDQKACAHAEMMAIDQANQNLGRWRLEDCQLFVTLEPCAMCAGAIVLARIPEVYIAATDPKSGMVGSIHNLLQEDQLNHRCQIDYGLLEEKSSDLLKSFFKDLRARMKERKRQARRAQSEGQENHTS